MSALFDAGPNFHEIGPRNRQWERHVKGYAQGTEPYMVAASTAPEYTYNGKTAKVLEPGTVMAQITDTANNEDTMVGPYDPAATDGREDPANIVGINNTFLPTELNDGNHTIGVKTARTTAYAAVVIEHNAGVPTPVTAATMDAMRTRSLDILFV